MNGSGLKNFNRALQWCKPHIRSCFRSEVIHGFYHANSMEKITLSTTFYPFISFRFVSFRPCFITCQSGNLPVQVLCYACQTLSQRSGSVKGRARLGLGRGFTEPLNGLVSLLFAIAGIGRVIVSTCPARGQFFSSSQSRESL